jgi:hypothetical protein
MQSKEFVSLVKGWQEQSMRVLERKSNDYANASDCLSNFKKSAQMCNTTPEKVFEVMMSIKICRLVELLDGKEVKNESVDDTLLDLSNYATLCRAYLYEKQNLVKQSGGL